MSNSSNSKHESFGIYKMYWNVTKCNKCFCLGSMLFIRFIFNTIKGLYNRNNVFSKDLTLTIAYFYIKQEYDYI